VTAFTDAAVAIALTLLVLPLVENVRQSGGGGSGNKPLPVHTLLHDNARAFLAFALSFLVIARFWRIHRRLFDDVTHLDEVLVMLNVVWLFGVVFLPVPTAVLVAAQGAGQGAAALYALNLLFVSLSALALTGWIARHPAIWETTVDGPGLNAATLRGAAACALMAVVVPVAFWRGQWALLLLLLLPMSQRVAARLSGRLWHRQTRPS
jgi:uncharacterized membrane protein